MQWFSIDPETRQVSLVEESRTLSALNRMVCIAIGRWILSGLDAPDSSATDGVSEFEAAREFGS
jgi:hypothetical protein